VSLVVFVWGAVQIFRSGLDTRRGSDPNERLDIPVVT
jgi:hypothetical protein